MVLLIFGLGYAARAIAAAWPGAVVGTTRDGRDGTLRFDAADEALSAATHVLSSAPPEGEDDPVLARYGDRLGGKWLCYLSSTGVYGDAGGAWVDETAPIRGRRPARNAADAAWLALGARVVRLPGIYGPGRSALDRARDGRAHRTGDEGQVFSRIHRDDIASGVVALRNAAPGAYNLADEEPAPQDDVACFAARLLGLPPPPLLPLDALSPAARAFHGENRRVAAGKVRALGWRPRYPDYRAGLRALNATTSPTPVSAAPPTASGDQR